MTETKIFIKRPAAIVNKDKSLSIKIDGEEVGLIENGALKEIKVEKGLHTIELSHSIIGSNILEFKVDSDSPLFFDIKKGMFYNRSYQFPYVFSLIFCPLYLYYYGDKKYVIYFIVGHTIIRYFMKYIVLRKKHFHIKQSNFTPSKKTVIK